MILMKDHHCEECYELDNSDITYAPEDKSAAGKISNNRKSKKSLTRMKKLPNHCATRFKFNIE